MTKKPFSAWHKGKNDWQKLRLIKVDANACLRLNWFHQSIGTFGLKNCAKILFPSFVRIAPVNKKDNGRRARLFGVKSGN